MPWTQAQQQAIEALDGDVCVSSGAGSGKTGVLVERCVRIVALSGCHELPPERAASVGQLLVITFTEKATRELKQRLADEFVRRGLTAQRRELETAYISTIHGFCSRVLRENPFEAGLDPQFRVHDEVEARRPFRRAFELAVGEAFASGEGDIVELAAATQDQRVFSTDSRDALAALLASVERELARWRGAGLRFEEVEQAWTGSGSMGTARSRATVTAWLAPLCRELAGAIAELRRVAGLVGAAEAARQRVVELSQQLPALDEGVEADADAWRDAVSVGTQIESVAKRVRVTGTDGTIANPATVSAIARLRDAAGAIKEFGAVDPDAEAEGELRSCRFALLSLAVWRCYEVLKRRAGVVDNDDLQRQAVHLLESVPDVLQRYRARFRHVLVDEFQDTSPVQLKLVRLLGGMEGAPADATTPGVFIVGDVQQSIYGFRDAEPSLFRDEVVRHQSGAGTHVGLHSNFRSRPELLRFINGLFAGIWREAEPPFAPLEPAASFDEAGGPLVEALVGEPGVVAVVARREAQALARRIRELVEGRTTWITHRSHPRRGQPIRYGDVAVLLRALTDIEHYERAFARASVPYFVVGGGKGYYARHEVRDLVNLLRVLRDPTDDLSLSALLRSPMFGVSCDTLYALAGHPGETRDTGAPLIEQLRRATAAGSVAPEEADRLRQAHATIQELLDMAVHLPVGRLLEEAVRRTEYVERLALRPNGRRRSANVRKLLQMASASDAYGAGDFVDRLNDLETVSDREGDAPTEEEAADVVRILTIHKAKGLEFPVVAIAGLHRSGVRPERALFVSDPHSLAIGCRVGGYTTGAYRALDACRRREEDAESMRLLYVAMTRARERLILSGAAGGGRGGPTWADIVFTSAGITVPQEPEVRTTTFGVPVALWPMDSPADRRSRGSAIRQGGAQ